MDANEPSVEIELILFSREEWFEGPLEHIYLRRTLIG